MVEIAPPLTPGGRSVSIDRAVLLDADSPLVPPLDLSIIYSQKKESLTQDPHRLALALEIPAERAFDRVRLQVDLRVGFELSLKRCVSNVFIPGR